jgi:hypothetical protein
VAQRFLRPEPAQGAPTAVTTPARMNVRGGPGTNYPVVASAPAGSVYVVVGINPARELVPGQRAGPPGACLDLCPPVDTERQLRERAGCGEYSGPPCSRSGPDRHGSPGSRPRSSPAAAPNTSTGFGYGMSVNMWQGDKQGVADSDQTAGIRVGEAAGALGVCRARTWCHPVAGDGCAWWTR